MPRILTVDQWRDHYATDPATTADAPRLGALIAFHATQALLAFLQVQPLAVIVSAGPEDDRWEVFARPEPHKFDRHPAVHRVLGGSGSWDFEEGSVDQLKAALEAGRLPFLMQNKAVVAEVARHLPVSIPSRPWQAQKALAHLGLGANLTVAEPTGPGWSVERLEALRAQLAKAQGWATPLARQAALDELIAPIPKAPSDMLVKVNTTPRRSRPR